MKRMVGAFLASMLLVFSIPAFAQNDNDRNSNRDRDRSEMNSNRDRDEDRNSTVDGDRREDRDDSEARNDRDDDEGEGDKWGLLGLLGLLGLRRNHNKTHHTTTRPLGSTGTGTSYTTGGTSDRTGSGSGTIITP